MYIREITKTCSDRGCRNDSVTDAERCDEPDASIFQGRLRVCQEIVFATGNMQALPHTASKSVRLIVCRADGIHAHLSVMLSSEIRLYKLSIVRETRRDEVLLRKGNTNEVIVMFRILAKDSV
jgi:hypothetical protein